MQTSDDESIDDVSTAKPVSVEIDADSVDAQVLTFQSLPELDENLINSQKIETNDNLTSVQKDDSNEDLSRNQKIDQGNIQNVEILNRNVEILTNITIIKHHLDKNWRENTVITVLSL